MTRTRVLDLPRADGTVDKITLRGLDPAGWVALIAAHPAPEGSSARWDADSFEPELLSRCLISHQITDEVARDLANEDGYRALIQACVDLCEPIPAARRYIEQNPGLIPELAFSNRAGIPLSLFRGWSDEDQDLALGYEALRRDTCPGCGVPERDMRNPDAPWTPRVRTCRHCEGLAQERHRIRDIEGPSEAERDAAHVDLTYDPVGDPG